ncbi:MAG: hypothetical protein CL610_10210 [Anaerolineaceae bacterium]|nr:hypothetical protein [Anaerolineaceae bacterium]
MIRYHQQVCSHCQGSGSVQRAHQLTVTCPLCYGKGAINDFTRPIKDELEQRGPPAVTTVLLLSKWVPLGKKTSMAYVANRYGSRLARRSASPTLGEQYGPLSGEAIEN